VPKLGDLTGVWNTIRELNVTDIRETAEQPFSIALIGEPIARATVARALYGQPGRFPATRAPRESLLQYDLPLARDRQAGLSQASLLLLVIDGRPPFSSETEKTLDKLTMLASPTIVVYVGTPIQPVGGLNLAPSVFFDEDATGESAEALMHEIVERLPEDQRVAAARRLPGLREAVARALIADTSFSNATYALTSALPELIPVLNIPLNAADLLVLTKNQALMVYRLGLAFGESGEFQDQMREIMPVIGSGFLWRQAARQLIGLVPGFGLVPKVAVAYAGTYTTGHAALVWYSRGETLSKGALGKLYRQALAVGHKRAAELRGRFKAAPSEPTEPFTGETKRFGRVRSLRRFLPGGKSQTAPPEE
jgi:uncharacterized protein (DUF697 family)